MWSVGSKPIRSNVTIPTASFSRIFFHKWHHVPCIMTSFIIPSPSILNIWRRVGLTARISYLRNEKYSPRYWNQSSVTKTWFVVSLVSQTQDNEAVSWNSLFHRLAVILLRVWLWDVYVLWIIFTDFTFQNGKYSVNRGFDIELNIRLEPVASGSK